MWGPLRGSSGSGEEWESMDATAGTGLLSIFWSITPSVLEFLSFLLFYLPPTKHHLDPTRQAPGVVQDEKRVPDD